MRPPTQTRKAVEADLKNLSVARDRARQNGTRMRTRNAKMLKLLSELIELYEEERHEHVKREVNEMNERANLRA